MRILKITGVFVVGLIATWVAVVAIGVAYMNVFNVFDRDGGGAMGLIFMVGPFFGCIGGIVLALVYALRKRSPEP